MSRQPLNTEQEKFLYFASLYGFHGSLSLLENQVKYEYNQNEYFSSNDKMKFDNFHKEN